MMPQRGLGLAARLAGFALAAGIPAANAAHARCPPPAPVLRDMSGLFAFYRGDSTQSVIDPGRMQYYAARMQGLIRFKADLADLQQDVIAGPDKPSARACLARHLDVWARRRALLKGLDRNDPVGARQAALEIAWATVAVAHAYDVLAAGAEDGSGSGSAGGNGRGSNPDASGRIRDWLEELAVAVRANFAAGRQFEGKLAWLGDASNHLYWAGAAVGAAAAITGNAEARQWAVAQFDRALAATAADGSLEAEMRRGSRAVQYQLFALTAVAVLVRQIDASGGQIDTGSETRLQALTRFSLALLADPGIAQRRNGTPQNTATPDSCGLALLKEHFRMTAPALFAEITAALAIRPPRCTIIAYPAISLGLGGAPAGGPKVISDGQDTDES